MSGKRTYILDTSVLLHNPQAIYAFEDNKVVIPLSVITQLDRFKQGNQEVNRTARQVIHEIDQLRHKQSLAKGVPLPQGGMLQVISEENVLEDGVFAYNKDEKLALAQYLQFQGEHVVIVTKNLNTRITADALGIGVSDLQKDKIDLIYKGWREYIISAKAMEEFRLNKRLAKPQATLFPNEFVVLINESNAADIVVTRAHPQDSFLQPLRFTQDPVYGLRPRNSEQMMAIELLMNPYIELVTLVGAAGTGKTLLALACGLKRIIEDHTFLKMLITRPIVPVGKDIGYLPGTKEKKLGHWMQPIFDNIDVLINSNDQAMRERLASFLDSNLFEMEALTYMRGRSLPRQFMIIDEAQNLTPHEIKTIISRAGQKTKIVLTGDPHQIDNPYLDASTNGLTYVVERLKTQPTVGHVTLERSERSSLAALAVELL